MLVCVFTSPSRRMKKKRKKSRRKEQAKALFLCETHRGFVCMLKCGGLLHLHHFIPPWKRIAEAIRENPSRLLCINDPGSGLIAFPVCKCQAPCKYKWHTCACCLKSHVMCKWAGEGWGLVKQQVVLRTSISKQYRDTYHCKLTPDCVLVVLLATYYFVTLVLSSSLRHLCTQMFEYVNLVL